jgi:Uma2 family endonuclease
MTAMTAAQRMTAKEFIAAPEPDHGRPWNLVGGEVIVNDPTILHGRAQKRLLVSLESWAGAGEGRGSVEWPADVGVDERNVFVPDLLWYAEGRAPGDAAQPPYPMPDLAVEIRSPATWRFDIGAKKDGYERHGLPELWLVDTLARTLLVFRRSTVAAPRFDVALELEEGEQLTSPLLRGFVVPVATVFSSR